MCLCVIHLFLFHMVLDNSSRVRETQAIRIINNPLIDVVSTICCIRLLSVCSFQASRPPKKNSTINTCHSCFFKRPIVFSPRFCSIIEFLRQTKQLGSMEFILCWWLTSIALVLGGVFSKVRQTRRLIRERLNGLMSWSQIWVICSLTFEWKKCWFQVVENWNY